MSLLFTQRFSGIMAFFLLGGLVPWAGGQDSPANDPYKVLTGNPSDHVFSSDHFAVRWNDSDGVQIDNLQVQAGLAKLESLWRFYTDSLGFPKPYADSQDKYKVNVFLSDKGWASGSGTGARDPAMWLNYKAFLDGHALAHELTHSLQFATQGLRDSPYTGWFWESHAEWMAHQTESDRAGCSEQLVNAPHLYYGSTRDRYGNWQFWEFLKDQFGIQVINDLWIKAKKPDHPDHLTESPLTVLCRNMKWSPAQLGDEFGLFAMHNVTWDYTRGELYRKVYGSYSDSERLHRYRTSLLFPVSGQDHTYAIPDYHAPQQFGYNLVRLRLNPGATQIQIHFHGIMQKEPGVPAFSNDFSQEPALVPQPDSDWRWGVVTVDATGRPTYSPLQTGSQSELTTKVTGVAETWLVVVATPTHYHKILWDQMYYSIYRYPWVVQLEGGQPEGTEPVVPPIGRTGAPHPNGGGWVENTAQVDPTAYVGPEALVLDHAQILGDSRIEGRATVSGNAVIKDHANIRDHALVTDRGMVAGEAIVEDEASIYSGLVDERAKVGAMTLLDGPTAHIHGDAVVNSVMNAITKFDISGTTELLGDLELNTSVRKGVYYGMVNSEMLSDPHFGAERTSPCREVTVSR